MMTTSNSAFLGTRLVFRDNEIMRRAFYKLLWLYELLLFGLILIFEKRFMETNDFQITRIFGMKNYIYIC